MGVVILTLLTVVRDMKLDNLLLSQDGIKIADFGTAITLDGSMKLPFTFRKYLCIIMYRCIDKHASVYFRAFH